MFWGMGHKPKGYSYLLRMKFHQGYDLYKSAIGYMIGVIWILKRSVRPETVCFAQRTPCTIRVLGALSE